MHDSTDSILPSRIMAGFCLALFEEYELRPGRRSPAPSTPISEAGARACQGNGFSIVVAVPALHHCITRYTLMPCALDFPRW
jgi:hypothetical protein